MNNYVYDYYKILNVSPLATYEEIRSSYRKLCKFAHPDVGGSTEAMQLLNEAYSILSKPLERAIYDLWYNDNISNRPGQQKIILHYLDYDSGKCVITENVSSFKFDIQQYIYNGDLYAITREIDGKKQIQICSYEYYKILDGYYEAQGFNCSVITKRGREKKKYLLTSKIKNNYKKFLNANECPLYVKQEGKEYIAICAAEYNCLLLSATAARSAAQKNYSGTFRRLCWVFLIPLVGIIFSIFANYTPEKEYTKHTGEPVRYNEQYQERDYTPPEKALPEHNSVQSNYRYQPNFFVNTKKYDEDYYYYLKFVDTITNETVQSIFIYSGEFVSVYVPSGTYELKWVSGTKWYGFEYYFLNNSAQIADDTFTFDGNIEWTVTHYPVRNGNLSTDTIPINEF